MVANRFDHHTRTAVIDWSDTPAVPYDLFLTVNHITALGLEHSLDPLVINEAVEVINDLFYLVEYDLSDPVSDLFEDEQITLETFFRRYGIQYAVFDLSDDSSDSSPVAVVDFPFPDTDDDDSSFITDEEEALLTQEVYIERNF